MKWLVLIRTAIKYINLGLMLTGMCALLYYTKNVERVGSKLLTMTDYWTTISIIVIYCLLDGKLHEGKDQGWFVPLSSVPRTVPRMKEADEYLLN